MGKLVTNNNHRILTKEDIIVSKGPYLYDNYYSTNYNYRYVCPFGSSRINSDGAPQEPRNVNCFCTTNYFTINENFFKRAIPPYCIIRNNISFDQYECIRDDKSIAIRSVSNNSWLLMSITLPSDGGGVFV